MQRGDIERRQVESNAQPALSRASVDQYAQEWAARQADTERRRREREHRTPSGPPDDEHVWLDPRTAALVLGLSVSRLRQLASGERVPFTMNGRPRWYRRDHVEQLAAARTLSSQTIHSGTAEGTCNGLG